MQVHFFCFKGTMDNDFYLRSCANDLRYDIGCCRKHPANKASPHGKAGLCRSLG